MRTFLTTSAAAAFFLLATGGAYQAAAHPQGDGTAMQVPQKKRPILYVEKAIDDIAVAAMEGDKQVVYVNKEKLDKLPAAARTFVLEHEFAHHVLRHVQALSTSGGFLNAQFRRDQEEEADCYAARTFIARKKADDLKEVLAFVQTLPTTTDHPLPSWRRDQISECVGKAQINNDAENDPRADEYLINDQIEIDWRTEGTPPNVGYTFTYRNGGTIPLRCAIVVSSGHVPRDAAKRDYQRWLPFDTTIHRFTLAPGERYFARGRLTWFRQDDTMPRLHYAHTDNGDDTELKRCTFLPGYEKPPAPVTYGFSVAVPKLIEASRNEFRGLLGPMQARNVTHKALVLLPGTQTCEVELKSSDAAEYSCETPETNVLKVAEDQYSFIVEEIKKLLPPGWQFEEEINRDQHKDFSASPKDKDIFGPSIQVTILDREDRDQKKQRIYTVWVRFKGPGL
ncbi:MAG TPA: hypothetical protein VJ464_02540 [Blastocatellia bacterium]|nr:hypothetical protein [Blastocatellia bacterium]